MGKQLAALPPAELRPMAWTGVQSLHDPIPSTTSPLHLFALSLPAGTSLAQFFKTLSNNISSVKSSQLAFPSF